MMTIIITVLLSFIALALIVVGMGMFLAFRFALRHFDTAVKAEFATQSREQLERVAMKITNPLARNLVHKYLVTAGTALTVAMVRGGLESRMRTGFYLALGGIALLVASFATPSWLPSIVGI